MLKLSGLVLDLYDDSQGQILRELYPAQEDVPEIVKQAHLLTHAERQRLPDELFALVLLDEGTSLRKYACVDPGNTLLSMLYFEKLWHKLPQIARERVMENFRVASSWYWDSPEAFEKSAGIGGALLSGAGNLLGRAATSVVKNPGKALTTGMGLMGAAGAAKQIGGNLRGVNAAEHAAGGFGSIVA